MEVENGPRNDEEHSIFFSLQKITIYYTLLSPYITIPLEMANPRELNQTFWVAGLEYLAPMLGKCWECLSYRHPEFRLRLLRRRVDQNLKNITYRCFILIYMRIRIRIRGSILIRIQNTALPTNIFKGFLMFIIYISTQ